MDVRAPFAEVENTDYNVCVCMCACVRTCVCVFIISSPPISKHTQYNQILSTATKYKETYTPSIGLLYPVALTGARLVLPIMKTSL